MRTVYVYLHHQGFDFYLKNRKLSDAELYCSYCKTSDTLIGVYDNGDELGEKLKELFSAGYDLLPGDDYDRIRRLYCPE